MESNENRGVHIFCGLFDIKKGKEWGTDNLVPEQRCLQLAFYDGYNQLKVNRLAWHRGSVGGACINKYHFFL